MYNIGDHVIYGRTGICVVKDIGYCELPGIGGSRLYYTLNPVYAAETIFTPVDTSIFMRRAISRDEAIGLIREMPAIENSMDDSVDICSKELPDYYKSLMGSHDCKDLIRLIIMVYSKTQQALQDKRKIGQTDQNYMRNAEDMLYGEFSVALGIDKESVPAFIEDMMKSGNTIKEEKLEHGFIAKASYA